MIKLVFSIALVVLVIFFLEYEQGASQPAQSKSGQFSSNSENRQQRISNGSNLKNYKTARSMLWREVYHRGGKTLYCQQPFKRSRDGQLNVEHVFPMSWVTNALACGTRKQCRAQSDAFNQIEGDLHNLYPSRTDANQDRSSFRFGKVQGESRHYGQSCDFEVDAQHRVAEPAPMVRGEVARAMFYMAYQYRDQGLTLYAKQARLLRQWERADPPTKEEEKRNTLIQKLQGNRNPFIDDPAKMKTLFEQGFFER